MAGKMKILIAYDGSDCSDAALTDLRRAGLPATAEAVVLSVADVFLPPPIREEIDNTFPSYVPAGIRRAHEQAERALTKARGLAARARDCIHAEFPRWDVQAEVCADSPAWAVIRRADEWKPELIVVGSHGYTVLGGRLILGSVSQRVLYEARGAVRVARGSDKPEAAPVRLLIGTDGSPDAEAAIDAVVARAWPHGTEVRMVAVLDTVMSVTSDASEPSIVKWVEVGDEEEWSWVREHFEVSAKRLRAAGLDASVVLRKGNPKSVLVEEAEEWEADCVFLGARGMRGVDRLLLGSVSAAVAARAHCSVEVVRPLRPAQVLSDD